MHRTVLAGMRTKNQWDWTDPVASLGPIVARLRAGDAVGELALQKPNTTRNATSANDVYG